MWKRQDSALVPTGFCRSFIKRDTSHLVPLIDLIEVANKAVDQSEKKSDWSRTLCFQVLTTLLKIALWFFQSSKSVKKSHLTHYIYTPLDIINTITHLLRPHAKQHSSPSPRIPSLLSGRFTHHPLECDTWTCNTSMRAGQASETMGRVTCDVVPLPPPLARSLPPTLPRSPLRSLTWPRVSRVTSRIPPPSTWLRSEFCQMCL